MEAETVKQKLRERKLLVSPEALTHILQYPTTEALLDKILENPGGLVITPQRVEEAEDELAAEQKAVQVVVHQPISYRPPAAEVASELKLGDKTDVSGKSRCTGTVEDFVQYFRSRLDKTSKALRSRPTDHQVVSCGKVSSELARKNLRVIGMVRDKRETKNGHTLIEIEDEQGTLSCLVPKDAPASLREQSADVVYDEVLGFEGYLSGSSLFIVKEILWPDLPIREKKLVEQDISIAFLSDVHVGSRYFLQENFTNFIKFINGESERADMREAAGKIKYLFVAGDNVDGIGVYPNQERELLVKDLYAQYEIFAKFISEVPEHIEVVIGPGNHDAVRTAQPSPRLPAECTFELENFSNVHFVGSPASFEAHGLKVLMYHGDSFHSMCASMQKLNGAFSAPERAAIEMLKRRNLSPIYGENPIVPEHEDYLYIDSAPDIFHFGHVHHNGYANYRGTTVVNSGTWQDITEYQIKQGHIPTPCQLPVYSMRTGQLNVLNFR